MAVEDGVIKDGQIEVDVRITNSKNKLRITINSTQAIEYGDLMQLEVKCRRPKVTEKFNEEKYLQKEGILAKCEAVIVGGEVWQEGNIFVRYVWSLKRSLRRNLAQAVSEPHASFLAALIIGGAERISPAVNADFRAAGTSHLLAISGYNISLIITIVTGMFATMAIRKSFRALIVFLFITFFVLLVGPEPSVVRASIMGALAILASTVERSANRRNILLLSAVIMNLHNPLLVRYDIGFQLSFAATLGMLYGPPLIEKIIRRLIPWDLVGGILTPTLAATIFTIPIQAFYFGTLSLAAIPANLLLLPLVPYAMIVASTTMVIGTLHSIFSTMLSPFAWGISSLMLLLNHFFAKLSWAQRSIDFGIMALLIYYGTLFLLIWLSKLYAERKRIIANS